VGEILEREHFRVLKGAGLREFKASADVIGAVPISAKAPSLTILTEAGIEVVGALLVGAQHPHPVPLALAPDVPPARGTPPIVMNGEGATATFEGHTIPVYVFRGRPCVYAGDLGRALGYADDGKGLAESVRGWPEMKEPGDFAVLTGADLRDFKALLDVTARAAVSRSPHLMVLYETGMDLACQKAQTEAGARLRRYLADHVLPKLRRGEPVTAGGTKVPLVPALPKLRRGEPVGTGGAGGTQVPLVSAMAPYTSGPARLSLSDTPKFHPVLIDRLDEISRRLAAVEDRGRQIEARLGDLETRLA
jgi:prophage antirepressor-like protein